MGPTSVATEESLVAEAVTAVAVSLDDAAVSVIESVAAAAVDAAVSVAVLAAVVLAVAVEAAESVIEPPAFPVPELLDVETTHFLTSMTSALPFASVVGVRVIVQV